MSEQYLPESEFLNYVLDEEVLFDDTPLGAANLALLIEFMRDADKANRDWATFLLAQTEFDTPEIRKAFKVALRDKDEDVRAEALVGIAKREPAFARPIVADLLSSDWVGDLTLEAASYVADPALSSALQAIHDDPENAEMDGSTRTYLEEALESCATGIQPQWRDFDD